MNTGELRQVLAQRCPFATVHMDASHDTENAAHEQELRWRAARADLAGKGADEDTLTALDDAVRNTRPATGRVGRLLIAAGGEVLLDRTLAGPPSAPVTRVGACPYLLPLVALDAGQVPHVAALVDKIGADVRAVDSEGEDHPVHKVRGGGWSHPHIQHNVEETVHRNVRKVAEELTRLVDEVGARLLVVAGEPQVVAELRQELPSRCQEILAEPSGRREGEAEEFERIVTTLATERARAEQDAAVEEFRAALWTSEEPRSVVLTEDELRAVGAAQVDRMRADEALPAAALVVGAELVGAELVSAELVSAELVSAADVRGDPVPVRDGIGVLLRHKP